MSVLQVQLIEQPPCAECLSNLSWNWIIILNPPAHPGEARHLQTRQVCACIKIQNVVCLHLNVVSHLNKGSKRSQKGLSANENGWDDLPHLHKHIANTHILTRAQTHKHTQALTTLRTPHTHTHTITDLRGRRHPAGRWSCRPRLAGGHWE
jgi:hypothetical protein